MDKWLSATLVCCVLLILCIKKSAVNWEVLYFLPTLTCYLATVRDCDELGSVRFVCSPFTCSFV